jgi:flavin reductase (DIM6/NTAB) family NADH-FMN oxidoreductase RutF
MAAATGEPIGPFPPGADPEEYDKLRRRVLWTMPSGLYVVGSTDGKQRRNFMTLNWATQLSFEPKLIGVGIEREAVTHALISEGRSFSLCIVDREDRAIVRKFVKPGEVDLEARTINGFAFREEATGAPILEQATGWLDCAVRQEIETGGHTFFIGEVVACGFLKPEDTPVLRMEDTRMNYGG